MLLVAAGRGTFALGETNGRDCLGFVVGGGADNLGVTKEVSAELVYPGGSCLLPEKGRKVWRLTQGYEWGKAWQNLIHDRDGRLSLC